MDSALKLPLLQRINFRMIIFAVVVLALIGYPVYQLLDAQISGGVKNVGGGYSEVNLKAMGSFMFDANLSTIEDVPAKWRALDGKRVILEGEMYAGSEASDEVRQFQLVYSIAKCCFGGPPKVQERVFCAVPNGGAVPYYGGLARIKGVLHVNVEKDQGQAVSVFRLDVEQAEPVSG
jgi:hypothetical protein